MNKFAAPSRRIRYVADASYWIYITRLPVVCALQVWVAQWPLHWTLKHSLIMTVTFATLLATYHLFVRYTLVGAILNGTRHRTSSTPAVQHAVSSIQ